MREAFLSGKRGIVMEGGSRCFDPDQNVVTSKGSIPISKIKPGDKVKTPNGYQKVLQIYAIQNTKRCLCITLKNGKTIKCTATHKFYYHGKWVEIQDIIKEWQYGNMENNTRI